MTGEVIHVSIQNVVRPGYRHTVRGKGMPISKAPGTFGDLVIQFDVLFPDALTSEQKGMLRSVL